MRKEQGEQGIDITHQSMFTGNTSANMKKLYKAFYGLEGAAWNLIKCSKLCYYEFQNEIKRKKKTRSVESKTSQVTKCLWSLPDLCLRFVA